MLNKSIVIGRLTADPELKETRTGVKLCTFTLACERDYRQDDGTRPVDFIRCVAYRNVGERCNKWMQKGKLVSVCGRLQVESYTKDNKTYKIVEIAVDGFYLLSPREAGEEPAPDDLPF
jgi:single-strand DNA-binding protein